MIRAARKLRREVEELAFGAPVSCVYDPLGYAWDAYAAYLRRYGNGRKRIVFIGMNPGPFGMVQTGVPFGEVRAVRQWLGIEGHIGRPPKEHPRRPVWGWACARSEVSGRRLWGLFASRFGRPEAFFRDHFVANYCPLAFFDSQGRNLTPDKLRKAEAAPLLAACDRHLVATVEALRPGWVIGIGRFAEKRARSALLDSSPKVAGILHPSPASPQANKNWEQKVVRQLQALGIWVSLH